MIIVPDPIRSGEVLPVFHYSGGKDSGATLLACREAGIPIEHVAASDTQWELEPEWTDHLGAVERVLGIKIRRLRSAGFQVLSMSKASFPARDARWCTQWLKTVPLELFHERIQAIEGKQTAAVIGIRAEESKRPDGARAVAPVWEWDDWVDAENGAQGLGCWLWRPVKYFTIADVLTIHHRHGLPLHPLYRRGYDRVGCYPCSLYAGRDEIRRISQDRPDVIEACERLETAVTAVRAERNTEQPGRYGHPRATLFLSKLGSKPMGIRDVVVWANTTRGGRQLEMLQDRPLGGCNRWGMCDAPPREPEAA